MREIKFRGKRVDKNEWVYGSLISKEGYCAIVIFDKGHDAVYNAYLELEVRPKTVGQFTGLTDKNGKDIYEGDVVKRIQTEIVDEFTGIVEYSDVSFRAESDLDELESVLDYQECVIEVIGTIHD